MRWENVFYSNIATYISIINEALKSEYSLEPLSNHIKVLGGYAFKAAEYKSEGIPVIRISDFQDEKIDLSSVRFYRQDKSYDKFQLFAGDIIIAMTGGTIGKLAIVQEGLGKLYLNQRVGKFQILNEEAFEPEYVYWLARGIQDKVKNLGYGGAQPNVSNAQIESLLFPFPPKNVQQKITLFLKDLKSNELKNKTYFNDKVEAKIKEFQNAGISIFKLLEECTNQQFYLQLLRQTILQEAVQGKLTQQNPADEPASELLKRIKAEKQKAIKEGKLKKEKELPPITDDEIPFALPEGWVWCRLGELILKSEAGKSLVCERREAIHPEWGIIKVSAMSWGKFDEKENKVLPTNVSPTLEYKINEGDYLISRANTEELIGKSVIVGDLNSNLLLSDKSIRLVFSEQVSKSYLKFYNDTNFAREYYKRVASGTSDSMKNITREQMYHLPIPLPSYPIQNHIVEKVESFFHHITQLEQQVTTSQTQARQLLQAVLAEAFEAKGKVYEVNGALTLAAEE